MPDLPRARTGSNFAPATSFASFKQTVRSLQSSLARKRVDPDAERRIPGAWLELDTHNHLAAARLRKSSEVLRNLQELKHTLKNEGKPVPWVNTRQADAIVALTISLYAILIGIETDLLVRNGLVPADVRLAFTVAQGVFLFIFLVELVLRLKAEGLGYISLNNPMGLLDTVIIILGAVEFVLSLAQTADLDASPVSSSLRASAALRTLRVLRLMRLMRLLMIFRELRLLIIGMLSSMKTVAWAFSLLLIFMYLGTLFCVILLSREPTLEVFFGGVGRGLFTHFQLVTMEAWPEIADATILVAGPIWGFYFVAYICSTSLALMNLVTGVVCEKLIDLQENKEEEENPLQEYQNDVLEFKETMLSIFKRCDQDSSDTLDTKEFITMLKREDMQKLLAAMDISSNLEGEQLFEILDEKGKGHMTCEEVAEALLRLRGSRYYLHSMMLQRDCVRWHRRKAAQVIAMEKRARIQIHKDFSLLETGLTYELKKVEKYILKKKGLRKTRRETKRKPHQGTEAAPKDRPITPSERVSSRAMEAEASSSGALKLKQQKDDDRGGNITSCSTNNNNNPNNNSNSNSSNSNNNSNINMNTNSNSHDPATFVANGVEAEPESLERSSQETFGYLPERKSGRQLTLPAPPPRPRDANQKGVGSAPEAPTDAPPTLAFSPDADEAQTRPLASANFPRIVVSSVPPPPPPAQAPTPTKTASEGRSEAKSLAPPKQGFGVAAARKVKKTRRRSDVEGPDESSERTTQVLAKLDQRRDELVKDAEDLMNQADSLEGLLWRLFESRLEAQNYLPSHPSSSSSSSSSLGGSRSEEKTGNNNNNNNSNSSPRRRRKLPHADLDERLKLPRTELLELRGLFGKSPNASSELFGKFPNLGSSPSPMSPAGGWTPTARRRAKGTQTATAVAEAVAAAPAPAKTQKSRCMGSSPSLVLADTFPDSIPVGPMPPPPENNNSRGNNHCCHTPPAAGQSGTENHGSTGNSSSNNSNNNNRNNALNSSNFTFDGRPTNDFSTTISSAKGATQVYEESSNPCRPLHTPGTKWSWCP